MNKGYKETGTFCQTTIFPLGYTRKPWEDGTPTNPSDMKVKIK